MSDNDDDWFDRYMRDKQRFNQSKNVADLPHYEPAHNNVDIEKLLRSLEILFQIEEQETLIQWLFFSKELQTDKYITNHNNLTKQLDWLKVMISIKWCIKLMVNTR